MTVFSRLVFLSLMASLVFGCAPRKIPVERPPLAVWNDFRSGLVQPAPDRSFLISASVVYTTPDQRNRIQSSLWGYFGYPIRMDLSAGVGQIISMWYEDGHIWQSYFPGENIKYIHHDGSRGASMLGFPTPLDLKQTVHVLFGAFGGIVPDSFEEVRSHDGMWKYFFNDYKVESVVLSQDGSVRIINGRDWRVELSAVRHESFFHYYSRIDMQLGEHDRALIRIRSFRVDDHEWDDEQLEFMVPEDAGVVHLSDL